MQASARQQELERLFNARKGHNPHISISDDSHHITEAIGSYYGSEQESNSLAVSADNRPLSYMSAPSEARFTAMPRSTSLSNRHAGHYDGGERAPLPVRSSSDVVPGLSITDADGSASDYKRLSTLGSEDMSTSPNGMSAQEAAVQSFPLNDIDYESSPAAVAQELSNLQAIRRMSMNIDMADPDLPSFTSMTTVPGPPGHSTDDDDPSKLFWVPARLHPELAPKEFKTFVEERVDKIRRRSGSEDALSPDSPERSPSGAADLRRKKSMLSHSIDTRGNYEDGADRLERKRSKGMHFEASAKIASLQDLEELVNDPAQLVRRMSLDNQRRSEDSGSDTPGEDVILPGSQGLKRSTRTTYRRGSLRKGERVPFSKRAANRHGEHEPERRQSQDDGDSFEAPILGLTRVQTEPIPEVVGFDDRAQTSQETKQKPYLEHTQHEPRNYEPQQDIQDYASFNFTDEPASQYDHDDFSSGQQQHYSNQEEHYHNGTHQQEDDQHHNQQEEPQHYQPPQQKREPPSQLLQQAPQPRQFQSRIASQGRTTAQLPGYKNTNPLPHIIDTLPDGTKVPAGPLIGQSTQFPERKSSIEVGRPQRGAHGRPVPGRQPAQTLDDISSNPTPMPGSGGTRTDALTMIPTFEEKKSEKEKSSRKSSWKWILGNDDDDKKSKRSTEDSSSLKSSKSGKVSKSEKARLDLLQNSIEGNNAARPRESLVLNREEVKIEDDRKGSKKSFDGSRKEKEPKEPSLLATIFGSKKKTSDTDIKEKKRKNDRALSPEPPPRILKADIDYNWTRFSILEERAIYRMAHIKLANPRRALYSQVLLSNFMYSYLAKVQMMHPQMQIPHQPTSKQQQEQQRQQQHQEQQRQQQQQQQQQARKAQPDDHREQQRWQGQQQQQQQQQQQHEAAAQQSMQQPAHNDYHAQVDQRGYEQDDEYSHDSQHGDHPEWPDYRADEPQYGQLQVNGNAHRQGDGYSVASGHDYRGYAKDQRGYSNEQMWEDEESEDLW